MRSVFLRGPILDQHLRRGRDEVGVGRPQYPRSDLVLRPRVFEGHLRALHGQQEAKHLVGQV